MKNGALVFRRSQRQLLIGLDESEHGVVVWRRVVARDVPLDAALGRRAALCKFLDQLIAYELVRRRGLHQLEEQLC